ncbi:DNA gyrase subunit A [Candidatus Giovannonibacteria bacterium RIFCSPLOWO2_01_FULL_43_160]|uniref:DNA gyrase subunit A n=2 Tax=Candidatus Giovannoniibacteriota TaxID=1752738 RepID=A0A0G1L2U2_9BACT|nr:MAG: gyrase subunit A protein [Candidatus Giovannonibacteria bacterium GW2011_GWB1_43_13]KKS99400.1 MAG: gyrase subunit A protein [Candidatus Giovannonibacteria bacterium GW2011_GWA1_43_15]KKT21778.1 MAG: gyrase subunit A protein [Candidatus Giovannonibacteria bacterium GW2011_GWC2_43_8]KKT62937.1 MAG: gyrase subunit A protein [Candidatus Giovannonibacteria bacterium GW2011_GWA2_44_26]OGF58744.1 MAG: DNA gyrase subunit A [Candidatus Giovannonibacteria bacterium RIFCSPHIGHO2_01_FULL_43_140]O
MAQKEPEKLQAIGMVSPREIVTEMQESYLDYAMSVIVARALPDVRDGLKPVHRRILFAMHEMGLTHSAKTKKSANVVGEVLGKYHPHGDTAVYDSLVRMAQDFSLRYPLIEGQGNFGSIDGDSAAAMRYTEARMSAITTEMLKDIEKETVDFIPNYDGSKFEPIVLPAAIPQLLLNGSMGIAVGMATNIPPHNLTEVTEATLHLMAHPKATVEDLTEFVKGPDFPTGGMIFNKKEILQAYATGRGGVINRGEAEISEKKNGEWQIIITSIPYLVNKSELIVKMADLVHEKKLEGIRDIRDESDKEGLRISIDLKRDSYPQKVLNNLYKHTDLERAFHFNMIALVDGGRQPQTLSLKSILEEFIKHRRVIIERRSKFDLARAQDREHILLGLKKALDHIDAVIKAIRGSASKEEAHKNLVKKFDLSDKQAQAILEMRLSALAGLERQKIEDELKEKQKLIKELKSLLADAKKIDEVVKDELSEAKKKYADERKTRVISGAAKIISTEDLVPEEETILILTQGGYVKRIKPDEYRVQRRGGKGVIGVVTKEEDVAYEFISGNTHDDLLFFTNLGKVYQTKMYEIPEGTRQAKGKAIANFLSLAADENVTSILPVPKANKGEKNYVMLSTERGLTKKVEAKGFEDVRRSGIRAINLKKGDTLRFARIVSAGEEAILSTKLGQAVRFKEKDIRAMGRTAQGVRGMRLKKNDEIVGMDIITSGAKKPEILSVSSLGYGKKTSVSQYRIQKRGGSGTKTSKVTSKTGPLVSVQVVKDDQVEIIAISKKGQVIRAPLSQIPSLSRATQGVRIMKMNAGDSVASVTLL